MTNPTHRAARVEARLHGVLEDALHGRGWAPRVVPHVGYGTTTWVRVLARVLLSPPGGPRTDHDGVGVPGDLRGWRRFVSASAVGESVTISVDGREHEVTSDRDGYVDVRVPAALSPGWHTIALRVTEPPG